MRKKCVQIGTDELEAILDRCSRKAEKDHHYIGCLLFSLVNRRLGKWRDIRHVHVGGSMGLKTEPIDDERLAKLCDEVIQRCQEISNE